VLPDLPAAQPLYMGMAALGPITSYSLAPGHLGFQPLRNSVDEIFDRRLRDAR